MIDESHISFNKTNTEYLWMSIRRNKFKYTSAEYQTHGDT